MKNYLLISICKFFLFYYAIFFCNNSFCQNPRISESNPNKIEILPELKANAQKFLSEIVFQASTNSSSESSPASFLDFFISASQKKYKKIVFFTMNPFLGDGIVNNLSYIEYFKEKFPEAESIVLVSPVSSVFGNKDNSRFESVTLDLKNVNRLKVNFTQSITKLNSKLLKGSFDPKEIAGTVNQYYDELKIENELINSIDAAIPDDSLVFFIDAGNESLPFMPSNIHSLETDFSYDAQLKGAFYKRFETFVKDRMLSLFAEKNVSAMINTIGFLGQSKIGFFENAGLGLDPNHWDKANPSITSGYANNYNFYQTKKYLRWLFPNVRQHLDNTYMNVLHQSCILFGSEKISLHPGLINLRADLENPEIQFPYLKKNLYISILMSVKMQN
jgi:hypothetical protein